jgi:hypothetical protein
LENHYSSGAGSSGQVAKDALGNDVIAAEWLKTHGPGDRTLTQGLKVLMHLSLLVWLITLLWRIIPTFQLI